MEKTIGIAGVLGIVFLTSAHAQQDWIASQTLYNINGVSMGLSACTNDGSMTAHYSGKENNNYILEIEGKDCGKQQLSLPSNNTFVCGKKYIITLIENQSDEQKVTFSCKVAE